MQAILRAVVGALVAVLVASCGDTTGPSAEPSTSAPPAETTTTTAPEPVAGIVAEIGPNRLYAVHRAFGLVLRNVGDEPVTVRQVQLDSSRFASLPITDREVTLQPGGPRFVLPLPYGEVRCDGEAEDIFAVVVVVDDGQELHLDATEEYDGAVARLHTRECAVAEFKRPYVFLSWIEVGETKPVPVKLELIGGAREALVDLIAACSV